MKCKFLTGNTRLHNHVVRFLEITCSNGFIGTIFVTKEAAFTLNLATSTINTWHYELSENDTKITLTGQAKHSVKFKKPDGSNYCHETIINWPVENV